MKYSDQKIFSKTFWKFLWKSLIKRVVSSLSGKLGFWGHNHNCVSPPNNLNRNRFRNLNCNNLNRLRSRNLNCKWEWGCKTGWNWWQNGLKSLFTTGFNGGKISVQLGSVETSLWRKKGVARLSLRSGRALSRPPLSFYGTPPNQWGKVADFDAVGLQAVWSTI